MDRDIVVRARAGDRDAFATLVAASLARLNAVARLIVHDPDRAEDAVQDALIDAWRDLRALRDPDKFDAWLHRLLVRACYERAGKDRRRQVREIAVAVDIDVATTDTQNAVARSDQLSRAIRMLPAEQRSVLALVYYLDLPLGDAAEVLDIPVGTVKSRLHRAIASLRVEIEADARPSAAPRESLA